MTKCETQKRVIEENRAVGLPQLSKGTYTHSDVSGSGSTAPSPLHAAEEHATHLSGMALL